MTKERTRMKDGKETIVHEGNHKGIIIIKYEIDGI